MNFDYRTLFVGDLPNYCHEGDLQMLFSSFGPVVDVKIHSGDDNGRSSSYAFVTLTNFAAIEAARKHLDGFIFMGRKLKIRRATLSSRGPDTDQTPQQVNSLYIRFTSPVIDRSITEFDLHRIFAPFGLVEDVSIKESSINHHNHVQYGYGFVHFAAEDEGMRAAFQAVSALDRSTVQGITLHVELSRNLLRQFNRMNGGGDAGRGGGYGNEPPAYQRSMDMATPSYHSFSPSYSSAAPSRNGSGAFSSRPLGGYNVEPPFPQSIPGSGQIPYHQQPPFRGASFSSGYLDGSSPNSSHMSRRRPQDFGADRFNIREGLEDALQGLSLNGPSVSYLPNPSPMAPVGMPLPLSQQRQTMVDGSSVGSLSTYQPLWDNMEMKHTPPLAGPSPDPWLPFEPSLKGSEGQDNSITSNASGSSLRFPSSGDDFPKHGI